jgi:polyhydroxyalkanoate synthase
LKNASPAANPKANPARQKNVRNPEIDPLFERALTAVAVARAQNFLKGIRAYRHHPAARNLPEAPIIWQEGSTRLRDYNPKAPDAAIVLVIPSLINRCDILDLDANHSFLRALAAHNVRPLLVDWGLPGAAEKDFTLTDYVTKRLIPILDVIAPRESVQVLGYCMGGLLALALAALRPRQTRALSLLATPWDFHKPDPATGPQFLALAEEMEPSLKALGHMPVDIIQSLFASFQPLQAAKKFADFAGLDPDSLEARHFVLTEDWLNDGVPLTANVARECLRDWYGENYTAKGEWHIDGTIVDPRKLNMPAYVVVPGKDRIVPPESALGLAKLLPHATLHEPMTGHIGMIVSPKAPQQVWASLFNWLEKHG